MNKDNFPKFAVCLAAFNGMQWLKEQINSILEQNGVSVVLFISIDKSNDGTEDWLDKFATLENRIKISPHGMCFGGAGPNFFRLMKEVNFSNFDYVSFADQDDLWHSDKLLRAHLQLMQTGSDAYSSNVIAFWSDARNRIIDKSQPQQKWDFLFEAAGPGCTYVMKTNLILDVQNLLIARQNEFHKICLHDWFIYAFARAHGYIWVIDKHPSMLYRQHANNQVGVNVGWRAFLYRVKKVLSGWGFQQSAHMAQLIGVGNDPFVLSWTNGGRLGLIKLAFQANHCRRRYRDRILFVLSCIACSIRGISIID
jgi:rhamnosyltransferase